MLQGVLDQYLCLELRAELCSDLQRVVRVARQSLRDRVRLRHATRVGHPFPLRHCLQLRASQTLRLGPHQHYRHVSTCQPMYTLHGHRLEIPNRFFIFIYLFFNPCA